MRKGAGHFDFNAKLGAAPARPGPGREQRAINSGGEPLDGEPLDGERVALLVRRIEPQPDLSAMSWDEDGALEIIQKSDRWVWTRGKKWIFESDAASQIEHRVYALAGFGPDKASLSKSEALFCFTAMGIKDLLEGRDGRERLLSEGMLAAWGSLFFPEPLPVAIRLSAAEWCAAVRKTGGQESAMFGVAESIAGVSFERDFGHLRLPLSCRSLSGERELGAELEERRELLSARGEARELAKSAGAAGRLGVKKGLAL